MGSTIFNPSPIWISKKTGIQIEEVVHALEGLSVLGYLKKEAGGFYPIKGKEFLAFEFTGKQKQEVITEHAVVSHQILNDMRPDTTFAIDHRFMAGNKEIIVELYKDIQAALEKAFQKSQQSKERADGIYKITFTAVDVAKPQSPTTDGARS